MDKALVKSSKGITPASLAGSLSPILALLMSGRLPAYQVAALQLITVFLVQFLSILMRTGGLTSDKKAIKESSEPIKVQVVNQPAQKQPEQPSASVQALQHELVQDEILAAKQTALAKPLILESQVRPDDIIEKLPRAIKSKAIEEHPLYSNDKIDACLRHFLAILDPSQLVHMPASSDEQVIPAPVPLASWEQLLSTSFSTVAKHPTIPHLYSISAYYPDVPIRNLWELLIDITGRPSWDSMCYTTEEIEQIGLADQTEGATRQATLSYLATKGMFPVKANDMVMLSVNARLLPEKLLRLVCATTTVEHPTKPPTRSYTRMQLTTSGFIAEEDSQGGTRVTQLTDLSALGSWVPGKIIKMVTESMIPKSLVKIGEVAKVRAPQGPRAALHGDTWLPPVIGTWDAPTSSAASSTTMVDEPRQSHRSAPSVSSVATAETVADSVDDHSDSEKVPASTSRDMKELVVQLRAVNSRLAHLEGLAGSAAAAKPASTSPSAADIANGHTGGYHPPSAPFGMNRVTDNALARTDIGGGPLGWMSRLNVRSFVSGLGAGIFSTTTAATVAALVVFYLRRKKLIG